MNYIQNIRKKVGKDKIILNFTCGILSQSGKILLQKRADKGTWGLPGGALELGESALEALVREFYEETGVEVRVEKLLNVIQNIQTVIRMVMRLKFLQSCI